MSSVGPGNRRLTTTTALPNLGNLVLQHYTCAHSPARPPFFRHFHQTMSHLNFLSGHLFQLALLCLVAAALVAYLARTKRIFRNASSSSASSSFSFSLLNFISGTVRKGRRGSPLLDIPGPPALPVIGAKWCFWPSVGKYGHLQGKRQTEHWKGKRIDHGYYLHHPLSLSLSR